MWLLGVYYKYLNGFLMIILEITDHNKKFSIKVAYQYKAP